VPGTRGRRAALVVVACVALGGCGLGDDGGGRSPSPGSTASATQTTGAPSPSIVSTPTPAGVDWNSPAAVCGAFADTLFSGNPSAEGQTDPLQRAAKYVTGSYRQTFLATAPRLASWDTWSDRGATQLVHTPMRYVGGKFGKDTRKWKYRVVARRVYPADPEGNPLDRTYGFAIYCTLVQEQGHWRVEQHSQKSVQPHR
jgi:hypothetical protein